MKTVICLAAFAAFLMAGSQQGLPVPANKQEARKIAIAVLSSLSGKKDDHWKHVDQVEEIRDSYSVSYYQYDVWISKETGLVRIIRDHTAKTAGSETWPTKTVDPNRLISVAQRLMNAAGFNGPIHVIGSGKDLAETSYFFRVTPTYQGVPYCFRNMSDLYFEAETGKFSVGYFRAVPSPPLSMRVGISADEAQATVLSHVFQNKRTALTNQKLATLELIHPTELFIWKPEPKAGKKDIWLDDEAMRDAQEGRGRLVFGVNYEDAEHPQTETFYGFVDAQTGKLLEIETLNFFSGGGDAPPPKKSAFAPWNSWKGDMRVVVGKKPYKVRKGAISSVGQPSVSVKGAPVLLSASKFAVALSYDRNSGLLYGDLNGKRAYGKPNKALADLLSKAVK